MWTDKTYLWKYRTIKLHLEKNKEALVPIRNSPITKWSGKVKNKVLERHKPEICCLKQS